MLSDTAMTPPTAERRLADLFSDGEFTGRDIAVSGIAYDSRKVTPGTVFFALPGVHHDGSSFAGQAVENGAVAIVAERDLDVPVPVVVVDNARRAMAEAALRFWGFPDRDLQLIALVGTNGKSTVAAGLDAIWAHDAVPSGVVGTLHCRWPGHATPAQRTTPESPDLCETLHRMRADKVQAAVVEVSSHAIALDRIWGLRFAGAVFTNLTRDHLDYHGTFTEYRRVKSSFFARLTPAASFAAINIDDPAASYFLQAASGTRIIRYSVLQQEADVRLLVESHDLAGTRGCLIIGNESWSFVSPLWGRFNHSNLAAMAAGAWGAGIAGERIASALETFKGIPGRIERVVSSAPFDVFVDYAHTPDALEAVLSAARPLVAGRLLVLFGCGGDRDRGKRPEMARAVARWADRIYLTSDNPRSEDPERIIADVKAGFTTGTSVWSSPDRMCAIERVVADAKPGDLVLLCGKGHEETQEVAGVFHRFSDREAVVQVLAANGHSPQTPPGGGILPGSAVGPGGDPSPTRT